MNNTPTRRYLVVALSLIAAFGLQSSLLTATAMAAKTDSGIGAPATIPSASKLPPGINVSPSAVGFGNQPVGSTSSPVIVSIQNTGDSPLNIGSYALNGTNPGDFSVQNFPTNVNIAAGDSTSFSVTFTPTAVGNRLASIVFPTNVPGGSVSIPIAGAGVAQPGISISPSTVAFGDQTVGSSSAPLTVTIQNPGSADLDLSNFTVSGSNSGDFSVQGFPSTVPPGSSVNFTVVFTPAAEGPRSASISFSTNVPGTPTVSIPLSGTGVAVGPPQNPGGQTSFTYQGKLVESGANVTTPRDLKFKLFDDTTNTQIGSDVIVPGVLFRDGIFNVVLDFGSAVFTGATRSLEISVSNPGANAFTALSPRQPITPTPYAVRSLSAYYAATATNTDQLGGVPANQYVGTADPRMSDSRDPTAGSANYVQNQNTSPQALANFSIDGTGSANILNAATQFNLGGNRILATPALDSLAVGLNAGAGSLSSQSTMVGTNSGSSGSIGVANSFFGNKTGLNNTTGAGNSFFGNTAGWSNISGLLNSYFGTNAGAQGTTGSSNSFFGENAGLTNKTGSNLTLVGSLASVGVDGLQFATAIGAGSAVSTSNTLVLGRPADTVNVPGSFNTSGTFTSNVVNSQTKFTIGNSGALSFGNSIEDLYVGGDSPGNTGNGQTFVGRFTGYGNTSGVNNSFIGSQAGRNNTTGGHNTFVGQFAGFDNIGGNWNTFIGQAAGHHNQTGFSNTFIGQASGTQNTSSTHTTLLGANTSTVDGLDYATAVGAGATVTSSNTVALGRTADSIWIPGHLYLNQLGPAAATRLCWNSTNYQISTCSTPLAGTSELTEFNGEQVPTVLVNAIKEQQKLIDAQAKQIEQLKTLVCSMLPTAEVCSTASETK
ncbi:MAG: choice-of-anchor D domain-containing protein [Pyrinomonadaceae bacterium]|nr:choice-of-anchor D domain-containing protein [Pyrinomonadaceae bacterium]